MSKKIAVLTTNRSDYGLLRNVILKLQKRKEVETDILVSGTHLEEKWGLTNREIYADNIRNTIEVKIFSDEASEDVSLVMSTVLKVFTSIFNEKKYDLLIVLGDRFETFAVCIAAVNQRIPIAHIHGGEISEGALDDYFRHCITKMSYLHFTSLPEYRNRVIQLGENPKRVFCVGAPGVENVLHTSLMTKEELEKSIGFKLDKDYAVVTFHPVSMEENTHLEQIEILLNVLEKHEELKYIITYSNPDAGGKEINEHFIKFEASRDNVLLVESLGMVRYLSAVKYAAMVIGNSSSGLLEVPSLHVPTINIGDRQRGRVHGESVIDCNCEIQDIENAILSARRMVEDGSIKNLHNPYEKENTSEKIVEHIVREISKEIDLKKGFYDIII